MLFFQHLFQSSMEKAEKLKQYLGLHLNILNGEVTQVPDVVDFPDGQELCRVWMSFIEKAKTVIPGWDDLKEWFVEAEIKSYDANVLENMLEVCGNSGLSPLTLKAFRRDDGHVEGGIAFLAALKGVSISRRTRNTFLFRRLIESAQNIVVGINDVIGIRKDLRQEELNTLVLNPVRYNGAKLQDAWENALDWIKEEKKDFFKICKAVRMAFQDDQNVQKLVRIIEVLEEGHVLWMLYLGDMKY